MILWKSICSFTLMVGAHMYTEGWRKGPWGPPRSRLPYHSATRTNGKEKKKTASFLYIFSSDRTQVARLQWQCCFCFFLTLSHSLHIWQWAQRQSVTPPTQACRRHYNNLSDTCNDLSPSGILFCIFSFFCPPCLVFFFLLVSSGLVRL